MRKNIVFLGLLVVMSMLFTACGGVPTATQAPGEATEAPVAGLKVLYQTFGPGDVPTLDPAVSEDTSSIQVINEAFTGLTFINEETQLTEPAMANTWDTVDNADGTQTITFHLRTDIPWIRWNGTVVEKVKDCDGNVRIVNANDFAYGIMRNLLPANASPYGFLLASLLTGAADFNNEVTTDFSTVGVQVIDDATIALTFVGPAGFNASVAGLWVARPSPKWLIEGDACTEAAGDQWIEAGSFESYGPYTMSRWVHDSTMILVKNPYWPGTVSQPIPKIDVIEFSMLDADPAFANYEAGSLDSVAVPSADLERVKADPVLSTEFFNGVNFCSYYYGFNTTAPFVDDVRVRLALSEAVDRQSLIDNVLKGGQLPAQWFARPGLAAAPTVADNPDLGVKFDVADANAQLDAYLAEKGITKADMDLTLMFNTSSGHQRIAEAIQQMWKDNLGLDVKIVNQEWAVYLETVKGADTPQIWRMGWCPDYPDTNNYDYDVMHSNGSSNPTDAAGNPSGGLFWKNAAYEALVEQAKVEVDAAARTALYAQAEEILVKTDAAIIPIYWYAANTVTKPYVVRTHGVGGSEEYTKWDILPHQ